MNSSSVQLRDGAWRHVLRAALPFPVRLTLSYRIWIVHGFTASRLLVTVIFACIAFSGLPHFLLTSLLVFAMFSDAVDGHLSRKFAVETHFGRVLDLVADKALTAVCLFYAASRGVSIGPLCLIAVRDLLMIGMRLLTVDRKQVLPTSRAFGGTMACLLWSNTIVLVNVSRDAAFHTITQVYWLCALAYSVNLILRVRASARNILILATTPSGSNQLL
jgi:CDP-diacylglycerol--glycerol-3-phosphate 3-phosphatidyltransferase